MIDQRIEKEKNSGEKSTDKRILLVLIKVETGMNNARKTGSSEVRYRFIPLEKHV